jgi:GTP-sensing pleiotropic transcriptional regulator CodY
MTTATIPTVHELQQQILAAVRQGEEGALDVIKALADTVTIVRSVTVPLARKLPSPEAITSGAYDFAGQLLADQRKFTEDVLKATASLRYPTEAPAKTAK